MIPEINPYIKSIQNDAAFWTNFRQADIKKIPYEKMFSKPIETRVDIENLRKIFNENVPNLEEQALDEVRNLNQELGFVRGKLKDLTQAEEPSPAVSHTFDQIGKAFDETNQLLVEIGRRKHMRVFPPIREETGELSGMMRKLQLAGAEAASTAASFELEMQIIPPSVGRPYKTLQKNSTEEALKTAQELVVGIGNEVEEEYIEVPEIKAVVVPAIYARDSQRGIYSLNGKISHIVDSPLEECINTYQKYCHEFMHTGEGEIIGFTLVSLLGQSHIGPLTSKVYEIVSKEGFNISGQGTLYDVTLRDQNVIVTLKNAYEALEFNEEKINRKHAILAKRELTIPIAELKQAAEVLQAARKDRQQIGFDVAKNFFPSATAVDSISSPIATGEFAAELLLNF